MCAAPPRPLGAGRRRARQRRRAGAAAEPPAEPQSAPFTLASIGIKGTLTNKLAVYLDTRPNDNRHVQDEVILDSTPVYRTGTVDIGGASVSSLTPVFTRVHVPGLENKASGYALIREVATKQS